jgi:hypothetical protein
MGLRETIFAGGSKYGPPIGGLVKKKINYVLVEVVGCRFAY